MLGEYQAVALRNRPTILYYIEKVSTFHRLDIAGDLVCGFHNPSTSRRFIRRRGQISVSAAALSGIIPLSRFDCPAHEKADPDGDNSGE